MTGNNHSGYLAKVLQIYIFGGKWPALKYWVPLYQEIITMKLTSDCHKTVSLGGLEQEALMTGKNRSGYLAKVLQISEKRANFKI